jgi:exo-beta-1,3-glucanase (GH17 family)
MAQFREFESAKAEDITAKIDGKEYIFKGKLPAKVLLDFISEHGDSLNQVGESSVEATIPFLKMVLAEHHDELVNNVDLITLNEVASWLFGIYAGSSEADTGKA